jgi:hypothetical protein
VRTLKSGKAPTAEVEAAVRELLSLKQKYKGAPRPILSPSFAPSRSGASSSSSSSPPPFFFASSMLSLWAHGTEATGEDPPQASTAKAPKRTAAEKATSQKFELKTPKVS